MSRLRTTPTLSTPRSSMTSPSPVSLDIQPNPTLDDAILYTICTRPSWAGPGQRTAACNARHLVRHLGGNIRLGDIKPTHVARLRAQLAEDGHSGATVNRVLSVLSTVLRHCHQDGLLEAAPIPIRREKESEGRLTWFTKEEVYGLAKFACLVNKNLDSLILFAAYTGLRRGEIWRLRICDIDWEKKLIHVGGTESTITKTGTHRIVPLCPTAECHLKLVASPDDDLNLCPWSELFPNVDVAMRQFNTARDNAGFSSDKVFHSLRHSFGTWHAEKGTPIRTIMALMGHKDIKTTLRYAKATDESLFAAMKDL
jgi:integrase